MRIKRRIPTVGDKKALKEKYYEMYPLKKLENQKKKRKILKREKRRFFRKKDLVKFRNYHNFLPNLKKN